SDLQSALKSIGAQTGRAWADEIAKQIAAEASPARNAFLMTTPRSQKVTKSYGFAAEAESLRRQGKTSGRSDDSGSGLDSLSRKPDFVVATRRSEDVAQLHDIERDCRISGRLLA